MRARERSDLRLLAAECRNLWCDVGGGWMIGKHVKGYILASFVRVEDDYGLIKLS